MNKQDYNKTITYLIHLIVMNNAGYVARILRKIGYPVKNFIPTEELEACLLQLYMANENDFFDLLKNVPWNNGDTATNTADIKDQLIAITSKDIDQTKKNWWKKIIEIVQQENQCDVNKSQYLQHIKKTETMCWFALAVGIVIVVIIIIK